MSLIISNATILDGRGGAPLEGYSLWAEAGRIKSIGKSHELRAPSSTEVLDATGKFVIPGLMDANVHLLLDIRMENLVRHEERLEDLIAEAAQVALKNGLTTVFDTWGPRRPLKEVRDKINAGALSGSRMFCAGNIIGLDGPFSQDFLVGTLEVASGVLVERINSIWSENVGSDLTWMTPDQVAHAVRAYIGGGVDFVKYASSEHRLAEKGAFLAFSPHAQQTIVAEAHRAALTVQAHSSSVESLRVSAEVGSDIIQHCNMTGPTPIPDATLRLLAEKGVCATVFPFTQRRYERLIYNGDEFTRRMFATADVNIRNLVQSGVTLLLATDGGILGPEAASDPVFGKSWVAAGEDNLAELGQGHFHWMKAMEEKGFTAMDILKAATANIAHAYKKDKDLGTLEQGKVADMLVLDRNPLQGAENYRSIHAVIKDGVMVDRAALPRNPILTRSTPLGPERPLCGADSGSSSHPMCC